MKISYVSDLHLDFWIPFHKNQIKWEHRTRAFIKKLIETDTENKEVLCLGGDYSHYNLQTKWMIDEFAKHYDQILVVYGNHDYYLVTGNQKNRYKSKSINRILELEDFIYTNYENVFSLREGRVFDYKGIKFGGDIMWYPIESFQQKVFFNDISNDSKLIYGMDINFENHVCSCDYANMIDKGIDVMVSHVPLIHIKSHHKYASTACYYAPVKELPKYVIMGHSHEREMYEKADSLLYMNCIGYPDNRLGEPLIMNFEV